MSIITTILVSSSFFYLIHLLLEYAIIIENKKLALNTLSCSLPVSRKRKSHSSTGVDIVKKSQVKKTSKENIDLVVSGLVHIGVKKIKANAIVNKMCKDKHYEDAQDLFEACFPYINS